jgi:hypothetical protein
MKLEITIDLPANAATGAEAMLRERLPDVLRDDLVKLSRTTVPDLQEQKFEPRVTVRVLS